MSTICKLNPKVREARSMRAAMVKHASAAHAELLRRYGVGSEHEYRGYIVANLLERVAKSPYRTGARKDAIFRVVARALADRAQLA